MDSNICNILEALADSSPDTHFSVYHELMARKITRILLVASPYDAYVLEEDGSLASKIIHEYNGLNLSRPPRLVKVATATAALCLLDEQRFDMVIAMPNLADMDPLSLAAKIKEKHPETPVIELVHGIGDMAAQEDKSERRALDDIFVWTGDADLLLALVKNAEDRLNAAADTNAAQVRVLILVEDSPFYRSVFLPIIYREVVRQTQVILEEGLNEEHRLLKMRARPKILVADSYEAAMDLFRKFRPYVFGILSDTRFPKDGRIGADAGISLLKAVKDDIPHLPVLLLSAEGENREKAKTIPAVFVDKNSRNLADELHDFFLNCLGFGDFVFRSRDNKEIGRAANLKALEELLPLLPDEPVLYEAGRNRFSNWFMARSEITLASMLARLTVADFPDVPKMKAFIAFSIRQLRKSRQQGVVARFNPADYDPGVSDFVKIGNGSLGGKARGLAFMANLIRQHPDFIHTYGSVQISIPDTLVITTECYDTFVTENRLDTIAEKGLPDGEIAARFLNGRLPSHLAAELLSFLRKVAVPLSVRSSGLMEDAHFFPYAGIYKTYMLPNNHPDFNLRYAQLEAAVKLVYASTCFEATRRYSKSVSQQFRKDSMAVIVQNLVGGIHNGYFYPTISGIAQSTNFYPVDPISPEDGVARIGLGMGRVLDEKGGGLRFCPKHPAVLPQFSKVEDILENAQHSFYALQMVGYDDQLFYRRETNLEERDITDAFDEAPVKLLCGTYYPEEHRIRDTAAGSGFPVLTFAQVLKYDRFPLSRLLSDLLAIGRDGMGCPVEMEFSVNLSRDAKTEKDTFAILQIRPMSAGGEVVDVAIADEDVQNAFCYSSQAMGHGINREMADIVFVDPEAFDPAATREMAGQIGSFNASLTLEKRPYLLVGPGRWGSFDPWLGIPVTWKEISGVGGMVELRTAMLRSDASHGSHFFQRITSHGIYYLTVTEGSEDFVNWKWLRSLPVKRSTAYIRHVRLPDPFTVKSDGKTSRCVLVAGKVSGAGSGGLSNPVASS